MPSPATGKMQIELWTSYAAHGVRPSLTLDTIPADDGFQHFVCTASISSNSFLVRGRLPRPNKTVGVMTALNNCRRPFIETGRLVRTYLNLLNLPKAVWIRWATSTTEHLRRSAGIFSSEVHVCFSISEYLNHVAVNINVGNVCFTGGCSDSGLPSANPDGG